MKILREQIRKEIKRLSEDLGMRKYPLPVEIRSALVNDLKLRPLIRYVNNVKAANPSSGEEDTGDQAGDAGGDTGGDTATEPEAPADEPAEEPEA